MRHNTRAVWGVTLVVLGLPRNMDGSLGPKAREVLAFAETLKARLAVVVDRHRGVHGRGPRQRWELVGAAAGAQRERRSQTKSSHPV